MTEEAFSRPPGARTVAEFLETAAAATPVPGGGGIAALCAALAASMAEMSLNFTVGRKKYAAVDARAREILAVMTDCRKRLLDLVAADGLAYDKVAAAMKMPRETDDDRRRRAEAMGLAQRAALEPPLEMMRAMNVAGALLAETAKICNPNLLGDAGVAAAILPGAARAASLNVRANIAAFDGETRARISSEVIAILAEIDSACKTAYWEVDGKLCSSLGPDPTSV